MDYLTSNILFGIIISLGAYGVGVWLNGKYHTPLINPLLIGILLVVIILKSFSIPYESYNVGGSVITMFLGPATMALAYYIYNHLEQLKKDFIPIAVGCFAGVVTSIASTYLLCKLFGIEKELLVSFIPRSVTTPIAIEISKQLGGIPSITVVVVIITGILGAILCPVFLKLLKIKDSVAAGVAIGSCSHAVGTSKAVEIGEVEGAMSGIALCISGIITSFLVLLM